MKKGLIFGFVCAAFLSAPVRAQQGPDNDPDGLRGYVDNMFHHTQVDSLNLYNGLLTVPVAVGPTYPIGPKLKFQVMLTYSSRVNDFGHPSGSTPLSYMPYSGDPALGLGWSFTLGAIKNCPTVCYVGPDGAQHLFDSTVPGYATYLKSNDASQLMLHDMGSGGPYEMWDGDGNHYVFDVNGHVTGNDDPIPGFTHDFGRGRDGWYLTSLTDPFGNGLTVTYRSNVWPVPCPGIYDSVCSSEQVVCLDRGKTWIPQTISLPTGTIAVGLDENSHVSSFTFPVVVQDSVTTATWTLGYNQLGTPEGSSIQTCPDQYPPPQYIFYPWLLKSIQLPGTIGSYQFTYGNALNCNSDLLSQIILPTGATLDYLYGTYSFYHGRLASLNQDCHPIAPDASAVVEESSSLACGSRPRAPTPKTSTCGPAPDSQYKDTQVGVVQRTETVGSDVHTTNYVQFAFPFGETGTSPTNNCDGIGRCGPQSLTVVVSPTERDGVTRRAKGTLFWCGPKDPTAATYSGDRTGADIEERVYDSDPTQGVSIGTMPVCGGGTDNPFCANHAVRVTQRTYDYDDVAYEIHDRRLLSETAYQQATAANSTCSGCKNHQVVFSNTSQDTWEGNGRHYDVEAHGAIGGNGLGNDSRTITTTWMPSRWTAPNGQTVLPNLFRQRLETGSSSVNRFAEYNSTNGFLDCSYVWDADPNRQLIHVNRRWPAGDGTLNEDFTATISWTSQNPPYLGQCRDAYPTKPTDPGGTTVGTNSDAFGKIYGYQNGLLTSVRWINGNAAATWYAKKYTRDSGSGWITRSFDTSGKMTSYEYDSIGRVTLIAPPDGEASTVVAYPLTTRTTVTRNGGTGLSTYQQYEYDGLGRLSREIRQMPGTNHYGVRAHGYDGPGREYFDSEWGRCTSGTGDCLTVPLVEGTTSSNFDPFGRAQTVVRADGSTTNISFADSYSNYSDTKKAVTVKNLGGTCSGGSCTGGSDSTSTYFSDAFGRMIRAVEPGGTDGTDCTQGSYRTCYTYDVRGRLTGVTQGSQTRSFTVDPVGFVCQEITPEKGTVSYSYGSLGNVRTESPAGLTLTRTYDFAGRPLLVTSDEPDHLGYRSYLSNTYNDTTAGNSLGKLTSRATWNYTDAGAMIAGVTDTYTYDGTGGRLSSQTTSVSGGSGLSTTQSWVYNGLGLVADHYHPRPSGFSPFVVSIDYDAGLPVTEYANGIPMVKSITYQPSGALASYITGINIGHDVTTTITPDGSLPRPSSISTVGASANFASGTYSYDGAGNIMAMGADYFSYDMRSRLVNANLFNVGSQAYSYDRYGNLLAKGGNTFCSGTCSNNQISGASYVRGDLTSYSGQNFSWDALDRMTSSTQSSTTWNYVYDGGDERVAKIPPAGSWTFTMRDESKRVASEYADTTPSRDNVFLGNQLVASYANLAVGGNDHAWSFYASDHLGTPRLITDVNAGAVTRQYWPFGDAVAPQGAGQALRFAAMEFDAEGGTGSLVADRYYDHARSHVGGLGRFLSPDKVGGRPVDPQSWNRYAYTRNNPLKLVDQNGLWWSLAANEPRRAWIRNAAVEFVRRPSGRAEFLRVASSRTEVDLASGSLNSKAAIEQKIKNQQNPNVTFGQTTSEGAFHLKVTFDVGAHDDYANRTQGTSGQVDPQGVTTFGHEGYHVTTAIFDPSKYGQGDVPTSETGPAMRSGQAIYGETPDISREEARRMVDQNLNQPPPDPCQQDPRRCMTPTPAPQ